MKALIFNSGSGTRMGDLTKVNHKSMARLLNGETIFHRQLRLLWESGVTEVIVTSGPFEQDLRAEVDGANLPNLNVTFVSNPLYQTTNYIYSFYLAAGKVDDDVLLLHGDLVFSRSALRAILNDERENLVAVDKTQLKPDKDFKGRVVLGTVTEISVSIFDDNCFALQPLYKLSKEVFNIWASEVAVFIENGKDHVYAENALNQVSEKLGIAPFLYTEYFIQEVDTLEDLENVSAAIRLFDFEEQPIIEGENSHLEIPDILNRYEAKHPLLVCGKSFDTQFLKTYFDQLSINFVYFRGYSANPKYEEILEGIKLFQESECDFIISVGGGSALDTAKIIKLFSALDNNKPYLEQDYIYSNIKHLAIPTTAGTGSESTRFAVMYKDGVKTSIAHDSIIPDFALLEPQLLQSLSDYQKRSTLLDALCQCSESIWSVKATAHSQQLASEGLSLILENFAFYLNVDDESLNSKMLRAANLSGKAINITETTAAHAMSYKLTSMYGVSHGHAVALCLPGVWSHIIDSVATNTTILPIAKVKEAISILDALFSAFISSLPIPPKVTNSLDGYLFVFATIGLVRPILRHKSDLDVLTDSVNQQRLANNPTALSREVLYEIYKGLFAIPAV